MTQVISLMLTDEQSKWFRTFGINPHEFITNITSREIEKWQKLSKQVLEPIIEKEKEFNEFLKAKAFSDQLGSWKNS